MAVAYSPCPPEIVRSPSRTCCANRADDARMLARVIALSARPGRMLDVGCGTGSVALAVLQARPDIGIVGVDVSAVRCLEAERHAIALGLGRRFRAIVGSAFEVDLPKLPSIVANPPMLPTEPGFTFPTRDRGRELFWMRLLATVSAWNRPVELWLHLFDYQVMGGPAGDYPSVAELAAEHGFSAGAVHRGWRSVGRTSSIAKALPALRRLFPAALISVGGSIVRLADVEPGTTAPLSIPHSIVHLTRS